MIYKIFEGLSEYLIAPDGTAIHQKTDTAVLFEKAPLVQGLTAKLITDEKHTVLNGKRKAIRLVRRFTREELLKMYAKAKEVFDDKLGEVGFTRSSKEIGERNLQLSKDLVSARRAVHDAVLAVCEKGSQVMSEAVSEIKEIATSLSEKVAGTDEKRDQTEQKRDKKEVKRDKSEKKVKLPYFKIDGVDYPSARKASEALKISVNTVLKRAKANKDGWFYVEK